jgi:hypothetical protein
MALNNFKNRCQWKWNNWDFNMFTRVDSIGLYLKRKSYFNMVFTETKFDLNTNIVLHYNTL